MLTNLEINNGVLSPKFDIYNDIYTVTIEEDITNLDISYETDNENVSVVINGNENLYLDNKIVSLTVSDGTATKNIQLNINYLTAENTSGLQNYFETLEIKKQEEISPYVAPIIGASCFLIILIVFSLLFHKKKKLK